MTGRNEEGRGARQAIGARIFTSSALGLVCRIVSIGASLCLVPLMIGRLGITGYGMWETIVSLTGILYLLQSVMSGTLLWWMSHAYGRGEREILHRATGIGLTYICLAALVAVPAAWLARGALLSLLQAPAARQEELALIITASVALFAAGGGNEILAALAGASQQMGRALVIQTIARLGQYAAAAAGLLAGHGLWSMVAGQAVGSVICALLLIRYLRTLYPTCRFLPLLPTRDEIRLLYRYLGFMTISGIATLLKEQFDKLILAAWASPLWVGYYAIAARMAALLLDFHRFFYPHFLTAVAALAAREEWEEVQRLYCRVVTSVAVSTGLMCLLVAGGYDLLLVIWLGRVPPEVAPILFLLVFANAVTVLLTGPPLALCRGIGKIGIETTYLLVTLALNLGGTLLLVPLVGPLGTVYATAGTALIGGLLFIRLFHRNIPMPAAAIKKALAAYSIAILIAGMVRALLTTVTLPTERGAALIAYGAALLPAVFIYVLLLLLTGVVSREALRRLFRRGA